MPVPDPDRRGVSMPLLHEETFRILQPVPAPGP